jgi:hypothetical protein
MHFLFYSVTTILLTAPLLTFAQSGNLVNLPIGDTNDFNAYINAVYAMFISIAALIAVVKIIIAGVKYMFSDIVTQKSEAKNDIKGALLGLVLILSAVVILTVINPDLTNFDPNISRIDEREQLPAASTIESEIENCANSVVCTVQNCTQVPNGEYDCTGISTICTNAGKLAQPLSDDRRIACIGAGEESNVQEETEIGIALLENYLVENDYSNTVDLYAINSREQDTNSELSAEELLEQIEIWAEECEIDTNGDDTGNEYVEVESTVEEVTVRACVN